MFNSRDSYTDLSISQKEFIELPYRIGTIIELKDNSDVMARICQYRITNDNLNEIIYIGLNTNIYEQDFEIDCEITLEELETKWKKTDKIIVGKLNPDNYLKIPGLFENFEKRKKLELTRKKNDAK